MSFLYLRFHCIYCSLLDRCPLNNEYLYSYTCTTHVCPPLHVLYMYMYNCLSFSQGREVIFEKFVVSVYNVDYINGRISWYAQNIVILLYVHKDKQEQTN